VVDAGWAGLAAAVQATTDGHAVTLLEMAGHGGGRARSVIIDSLALDNGQHILIGAYSETLRLMQLVGVDPALVLQRRPLELLYPDGSGLRLRRGNVHLTFIWAVARARGWSWADRWLLLRQTLMWLRNGMRNPGVDTVAQLCAGLPDRVRADLIDPLCIAALNTPSTQASATVFLRVLADALFGGPGSSDLLLPAAGLSQLFPKPAIDWLDRQGATIQLGCRVQSIARRPDDIWLVDDEPFDTVVLACSAVEAARLADRLNPAWSALAASLRAWSRLPPCTCAGARSPYRPRWWRCAAARSIRHSSRSILDCLDSTRIWRPSSSAERGRGSSAASQRWRSRCKGRPPTRCQPRSGRRRRSCTPPWSVARHSPACPRWLDPL
jgi:predicted NAD/FAD-binding protein